MQEADLKLFSAFLRPWADDASRGEGASSASYYLDSSEPDESESDGETCSTGRTSALSSPSRRQPTAHTGLVNLGSTCYLNSLIQCFYHIPYFRGAVFDMRREVDDSMPSALQFLFHSMSSQREPASTKQLTDSFGWDKEELVTQHDLHEMCIKLREKLEDKMKGTASDGRVRHLFQGVIDNVVRTADGTFESERRESFYELQLDIKGRKGVHEALRDLCKPERLDGNNKYKVEIPGEAAVYKTADRFVRFRMFPPCLVVHLKRFDIDYTSEHLSLTKLFDRFEYPETLDLSAYEAGFPSPSADPQTLKTEHETLQQQNPLYDPSSPAVYKVQSVIVHCGGARNGHYYACIRPDPRGGPWFEFNDELVRSVSQSDVFEQSFGGSAQTSGGRPFGLGPMAGATGYVLMYIRETAIPAIFDAPVFNVPRAIVLAQETRLRSMQHAADLWEEAKRYVTLNVLTDASLTNPQPPPPGEHPPQGPHGSPVVVAKKSTIGALRAQLAERLPGVDVGGARLWRVSNVAARDRRKRLLFGPGTAGGEVVGEAWRRCCPAAPSEALHVYLEVPRARVPRRPLFAGAGVDVACAAKARQTSYATAPKAAQTVAKRKSATCTLTHPNDSCPAYTLTWEAPHAFTRVQVHAGLPVDSFRDVNIRVLHNGTVTYDHREATGSLFNPAAAALPQLVIDLRFGAAAAVCGDELEVTRVVPCLPATKLAERVVAAALSPAGGAAARKSPSGSARRGRVTGGAVQTAAMLSPKVAAGPHSARAALGEPAGAEVSASPRKEPTAVASPGGKGKERATNAIQAGAMLSPKVAAGMHSARAALGEPAGAEVSASPRKEPTAVASPGGKGKEGATNAIQTGAMLSPKVAAGAHSARAALGSSAGGEVRVPVSPSPREEPITTPPGEKVQARASTTPQTEPTPVASLPEGLTPQQTANAPASAAPQTNPAPRVLPPEALTTQETVDATVSASPQKGPTPVASPSKGLPAYATAAAPASATAPPAEGLPAEKETVDSAPASTTPANGPPVASSSADDDPAQAGVSPTGASKDSGSGASGLRGKRTLTVETRGGPEAQPGLELLPSADGDEDDSFACVVERCLSLSGISAWVAPPETCDEGGVKLQACEEATHVLVFLQRYDPVSERVSHVGSTVVHRQELIESLGEVAKQLASIPEEDEIWMWHEEHPGRVHDVWSSVPGTNVVQQTFDQLANSTGATLVFTFHEMKPEHHNKRFPTVEHYYLFLNDQVRVAFDRLDEEREPVTVQLLKSMTYSEVTTFLAARINEDPRHIRLWTDSSQEGSTRESLVRKSDNRTLDQITMFQTWSPRTLFYDVLPDLTVDELEQRASVEVAFGCANGKVVGTEGIVLLARTTVGVIIDVLRDGEAFCFEGVPGDQLVLLEIRDRHIRAEYRATDVFPLPEDSASSFELRLVPEDPPGCAGLECATCNVVQFHERGGHSLEIHSSPFQIRVGAGETWSTVLHRMLALLELTTEDVSSPALHIATEKALEAVSLHAVALDDLNANDLPVIGLK
eukprot:gene13080-20176_t